MIQNKFLQKFTLVELLVVIAIIAVLASFLVPALEEARESAKKVACINRYRQIGLASMMYCDDFKYLPYNDTWKKWTLMLSCPLNGNVEVYTCGLMVSSGHIDLDLLWCTNTELRKYPYGSRMVLFTPESGEFGKDNFPAGRCYSNTVMAGQKQGNEYDEIYDRIDPVYTNNGDKAIYIELKGHHLDGFPAAFGDGHVQYFVVSDEVANMGEELFGYINENN